MKYSVSSESSFPLVYVNLNEGNRIKIERGSMVYHNGKVQIKGAMNSGGSRGLGGAVKALGRSMVSGEDFFITTAIGKQEGGVIALAPSKIGQLKTIQITATDQWVLNDGAFVACDDSVNYKLKRQKLSQALFGGTGGLFVMQTSGVGEMVVAGFGDLIEIPLQQAEAFTVDNFHVVAWSKSLQYSIKVGGGMFGFKTGEGLVNAFSGTGKLIVQTRNMSVFANQIIPFLPQSNASGDRG